MTTASERDREMKPWPPVAKWLGFDELGTFIATVKSASVAAIASNVLAACGRPVPDIALDCCLTASAGPLVLIDRIMDGDPGPHLTYGEIRTGQIASAMTGYLAEYAARLAWSGERRRLLVETLVAGMIDTVIGQEDEFTIPVIDEAGYWRVCARKAAAGFGCAAAVGAVFGGRPADEIPAWRRVGQAFGRMVQASDDLSDALAEPPLPDWRVPRRNLAFLYAISMPGKGKLEARIVAAADKGVAARTRLRMALLRAGAFAYAAHVAVAALTEARAIVAELAPPQAAILQDFFGQIEARIVEMMKAA